MGIESTAENGDVAGIAEGAVPCPGCGYDLRGMGESGRCSECGLEVDREALKVSGVQWAHRRAIGRVRAYVKTVWQVTVGAKALRYEMGRPQAWEDARGFRRATAGLLMLLVVGPALVAAGMGQLHGLPIEPPMWGSQQSSAWWDVLLPWGAGVLIAPVLPACLAMMVWWIVRMPGQALVPRIRDLAYQRRAQALGCYVVAPLAWTGVAAAMLAAVVGVGAQWGNEMRALQVPLAIGAVLAVVVGLLAVVLTLYQTGRWAARVRHGGFLTGARAAMETLGGWIVAVAVWWWLVPWCAGFVYVVFDSFR